jgi:hypothetical protein
MILRDGADVRTRKVKATNERIKAKKQHSAKKASRRGGFGE